LRCSPGLELREHDGHIHNGERAQHNPREVAEVLWDGHGDHPQQQQQDLQAIPENDV
jgi:hypothetical protein